MRIEGGVIAEKHVREKIDDLVSDLADKRRKRAHAIEKISFFLKIKRNGEIEIFSVGTKEEMESFGRIVNAYLDLAEERAKRKIPMTMQDWAERLDMFLKYDDRAILKDSGKITAEIAKDKAETEFEKYRIVQDHLFESDFDKMILKQLENGGSDE